MAIPTTTLNARVKQKIATDAYWISIEDELGVILEGEQAFVYDDEGNAVNFKIGDGTKKYSELPFFIAYFNNVTNCKVLSYLNQSANVTIPLVFKNLTTLDTLYFLNNSGSAQTIKIGTTDGGSEICEIEVPNGVVSINLDYFFTSAETIYITGLTGVDYSLFIKYYQLDEAPVIPSGGSSTSFKRWAAGTAYPFIPLYDGHTTDVWDLITGYGKIGTDYEGAVLFGSAALPISMADFYLKGYKDGETIGGTIGANEKMIEFENLPELQVTIPSNAGGVSGSGGIAYPGANNNPIDYPIEDGDGNQFTGQTAFNVQPQSKSVLFFTGVLTT